MDFKRRNGGPFLGGGSQAKRGKMAGEWEDSPSQFEEELSMFDEAEMEAEETEGQAGHNVIPVGECCIEKHTIIWLNGCNGLQLRFYTISTTPLITRCAKAVLSHSTQNHSCIPMPIICLNKHNYTHYLFCRTCRIIIMFILQLDFSHFKVSNVHGW